MKYSALLILIVYCIGCSKQQSKDVQKKEYKLNGVDFPTSIHVDYQTGKSTTVYESGRTVVKTIHIDSVFSKVKQKKPTGESIEEVSIKESIDIPDL